MDKRQLEPSLQHFADYIIEKVDANTNVTVTNAVDRAIEELAGITARRFENLEKHMDSQFAHVDSQLEDVKDHLIIIDNRIGIRPTFAFRES